jgi:hypothetical protein
MLNYGKIFCHFQQYFSYIVAVSFIGGGNRNAGNIIYNMDIEVNTLLNTKIKSISEQVKHSV